MPPMVESVVVLVHMQPHVVVAVNLHRAVAQLGVTWYRLPEECQNFRDPREHASDLRDQDVGPVSRIAMDFAPADRLHGKVIHSSWPGACSVVPMLSS